MKMQCTCGHEMEIKVRLGNELVSAYHVHPSGRGWGVQVVRLQPTPERAPEALEAAIAGSKEIR